MEKVNEVGNGKRTKKKTERKWMEESNKTERGIMKGDEPEEEKEG